MGNHKPTAVAQKPGALYKGSANPSRGLLDGRQAMTAPLTLSALEALVRAFPAIRLLYLFWLARLGEGSFV